MKYLANIAGALLGLLFIAAGAMVLLKLGPTPPPPPEGSMPALFMAAFAPSGHLTFVKSLEVIGGILVAIPKTRNLGLLVLGPIIINILAFHAFVMGGEGLFAAPIMVLCALALFLLWSERKAFAGLVHRNTSPSAS